MLFRSAVAPTGLPLILELGAGALLAQALADDECMFDTLSAAGASALALAFAAPELCADPDARTAAADQYALGAVGYFAVTGLSPYPHPALPDLMRAKRGGAPPSAAVVNPDVPPEFAAVLERMMAPDPAARFPDFRAVELVLADLAARAPAPAPAPVALESLLLSKLGTANRDSGTVKWDESASGALVPLPRDGSDASVTFDLPEASETLPDAPRGAPEPVAPEPAFHSPRSAPRAPDRAPAALDAPPISLPSAPTEGKMAARNDPRLAAPNPVQWHTNGTEPETRPEVPVAPKASGSVWAKLKRGLAFWKVRTEQLQVSVFGPAAATPGQPVKLTVFVHVPSTADNVRVLARAFQHDADLIGTGFLAREVAHAVKLAVHLSVANAGVAQAQLEFDWNGQPKRLVYELHVPWESPEGPSPGLISVGAGDVRIGKIEFRLPIRARKA